MAEVYLQTIMSNLIFFSAVNYYCMWPFIHVAARKWKLGLEVDNGFEIAWYLDNNLQLMTLWNSRPKLLILHTDI